MTPVFPNPLRRGLHAGLKRAHAAMREKLLDAAIDCLVEIGYARMTTTDVAERAGVSESATAPFSVESGVGHQRDSALGGPPCRRASPRCGSVTSQRTGHFADHRLDVVVFVGPSLYGGRRIVDGGRTDRELHAALWPIEKQHGRISTQLLRELYAGYADHPNFEPLMQLTGHMMRGMALQRILKDDDRRVRKALKYWEQLMSAMLENSPGEKATD